MSCPFSIPFFDLEDDELESLQMSLIDLASHIFFFRCHPEGEKRKNDLHDMLLMTSKHLQWIVSEEVVDEDLIFSLTADACHHYPNLSTV